MRLIMLYHRADAEKNTGFIELFRRECGRYSLAFSVFMTEDVTEEYLCSFPPDTLFINRSREWKLAETLEQHGFRVCNNSTVARLGNDKAAAAAQFKEWGIPIMESYDSPPAHYPYVMKSTDGHGGSEVFLIRNEDDLKEKQALLSGRRVLFQEFCDSPGRDLRLYIVQNRIVAAMLRESRDDFRSNYSLGGTARPVTPDKKERALAERILSHISLDFAAIDLIMHRGVPVFNELEDAAGSRMLYRYSDVDIVALFMAQLFSSDPGR